MREIVSVESRFDPASGQSRKWLVVVCCKCGAKGEMLRPALRGPVDGKAERLLAERLRREGWDAGNNLKNPVCPACVAAAEARRKGGRILQAVPAASRTGVAMEKKGEVVALTAKGAENAPDVTVIPPRAATPKDRRRIQDALDAVYDIELGGFKAGASDEAVAQRLDVPRAWVTEVREMLYGPAMPAAVAALMPEFKGMAARLDELNRQQQRLASAIATVQQDMSTLAARMTAAGVAV